MYLFDFFKNITKKGNIGILIYLILNIALITAIFSGGFQSWGGFFLGLGVYFVSLLIALSPIGEWILRTQNGCTKMTRIEDIQRFEPLFKEVYAKAKQLNPELPNDIKMFISDSQDPNAFATGRKTVCVTRGLARYSDEQIKGVLAHEFGHLAHKDTDTILMVSVGNMIVSAIFILIRIFSNISFGIGRFITLLMDNSAGSAFAFIFMTLGKIVADFVLAAMMWIWTKIGVLLCMYSSRQNEFEADAYAFNCGYGYELQEVLASFGNGGGAKGLFAALVSSHPDTNKRISRLQQLGGRY
ncbi:MAG: hypothetical protein E7598_05385 [Ruminococcaceae bacterium]|nr:hypothetical protein [Oscillospiraceae bacterium]